MAKDVRKQNESFLKDNGIILVPTMSYGVPYKFVNDEFNISLCEYSNINIENKFTGKSKTISMCYEILQISDLCRN